VPDTTKQPAPPPLVRVALVWFLALGGFGAFFPYATWYLSRTLGMSGSSIGLVMAMVALVGLVSQPFWGYVADRTGRRKSVLVLVTWGTSIGYAVTGSVEGTIAIAGAMSAHTLFSSSAVPSLWAVTMALVGRQGLKYVGWARVSGTVGFAVVAVLFPWIVARVLDAAADVRLLATLSESVHADGRGVRVLFPIAGLCVAFSALAASTLPSTSEVSVRASAGEARRLLRDERFVRLLAVTFLAFVFMQGPMVLFPLLVHAQGGGIGAIARMWIVMLALEVPLVASFGWSANRFGIAAVVAVGVAAGSIRWLVSGFTSDLNVAVVVQALHGVTVWGVVLGMPALTESVVPPSLRSTAQALLATVGFGLGSLVSNAASGYLVDAIGPQAPARFGGIGALALAASLRWLLPKGVGGRALGVVS
jgi:PPP family 3-phenylpropionic acid transporter